MATYTPIQKSRIPGKIIDQLMSMIRNGKLKPKERLPSERELVQLLQVGRSSVREALMALEAMGFVQRTMRGTFLLAPEERENGPFMLNPKTTTIRQVFETRKLMEIELAGLAAERALPENIKRMEKTLLKTANYQELTASDVSFHLALTRAARNPVFFEVYSMIIGMLFQTQKYYSHIAARQEELFEHLSKRLVSDHKSIIKAIQSHKPQAAKKAMEIHLNYAEKILLNELDE